MKLASTEASLATLSRGLATAQRDWFESAAEFSPDLGGVAMALLVGGPMSRVQPIYAQIGALMQQELARQVEGGWPESFPHAPQRWHGQRRGG